MGRGPCCEKEGVRKGAWTAEEDQKLLSFIHKNNGHGSWRTLPHLAGLQRCGKSCRLRWSNYLRPNIKRGNFTFEEEQTIIQLHELLGNKWAGIASQLPGRTDNEVKNHWNTHLKKRLARMGIDPTTHRPASIPHLDFNSVNIRGDSMMKHIHNSSFNCHLINTLPKVSLLDQSFVSHMAQWELARLEAEARLMSATSSANYLKYPSSTAFTSQKSTYSRGQGKENELLEVCREVLEAPIAHEKSSPLPSLDTSNSCSSACSQFMNEAEITSDFTYINHHMSPSPSSQYYDPFLALTPPACPPTPCEATSHAYWANMLSLVGSLTSSC